MLKRPVELFKSIFSGDIEKKSVSLTDPLALELFSTFPTVAGPSINAATALQVPAVYSAIVLITGTIGSLPAKIFRAEADGKRTANDHPAYRLVHDEANDWTSAGQLRARLTRDALLHNQGGFAFANRVNGRVVEFIRRDPTKMTVKADEATGEPVYEERDGNRIRRYSYRDILHIAAPLDLAPINAGREAIGLASTLERNAAGLFKNGMRPSGVLTKDTKAGVGDNGAAVITKIRKAWRDWLQNSNGDPLILDDGWGYDQATMTSVDAQFAEMRIQQVNEIARLFRIPPHLIFEMSRATWSNAEEMFQAFLTLTLRPWLDEWEWAYARVLLTPEERAESVYVEFVVDDLMTANAETRAKVYALYRSMGALTANEVRAGLNREQHADGNTLANPNITPGAPSAANDNAGPGKEAA
ncbi:phage portal protein [Mesorhizobium sp.]|uniref:phage portal protein n=1 Tax=Mesorhizobium sp. TaxID=1871066 RepID=UPI00257F0948|nr:phage portal protein [Mesorhizobium sp.]